MCADGKLCLAASAPGNEGERNMASAAADTNRAILAFQFARSQRSVD